MPGAHRVGDIWCLGSQYLNHDFKAADESFAQFERCSLANRVRGAMVRFQLGDQGGGSNSWPKVKRNWVKSANCMAPRVQTTVELPYFSSLWWEYSHFLATRRRAWELIRNRAPPDDPWQHLVQARGYRLIGQKEQADDELAAAKSLAPSDSEVLIAAIELESRWGDAARVAEADWQRAIELAGENSLLPLIQRGRWHAERGEHEKADADFAKAASLTSGELNRFLEAGWWVAGPYPPELKEFCPPELGPDPSQPVYVIDPAKGLSEQPVAWRYAPTGELGLVDLKSVFEAEQMSAYALTYVYSPDVRPATLLVGGDDRVRLWVNGRLEYDYDKSRNWTFGLARVPVILRPGRNVILAKVRQYTGIHRLYVRVADTPLDRAFTAAEQWRWEEAARLIAEGVPRRAAGFARPAHACSVAACIGRHGGPPPSVRRAAEKVGPQAPICTI